MAVNNGDRLKRTAIPDFLKGEEFSPAPTSRNSAGTRRALLAIGSVLTNTVREPSYEGARKQTMGMILGAEVMRASIALQQDARPQTPLHVLMASERFLTVEEIVDGFSGEDRSVAQEYTEQVLAAMHGLGILEIASTNNVEVFAISRPSRAPAEYGKYELV